MATARKLEDLDVWRLSVELRDEVHRLTEKGNVTRDPSFRDQIRDAASSAPRNIAEGFGRYKPRSFANFLRIALGSLLETRNGLLEGRTKGYFTQADTDRLLQLQRRAKGAATALVRYLDSCHGKAPGEPEP